MPSPRMRSGVLTNASKLPQASSSLPKSDSIPVRSIGLTPMSTAARRVHQRSLRSTDTVPVSMPSSDLGESQPLIRTTQSPSGPQRTFQWPPPTWVWVLTWCTVSVLISYADRTNISTAIIKMQEVFGWSDGEKGSILSVFFIGYAVTQLLGGQVSDSIGGKGVLSVGIFVWSLCTFITPQAANAGWFFLLSNRIALGLGEGVAFPAIHSIISANVPPNVQSTAVAVATAASYIGTVAAFGISPVIIGKYGWEWVFYGFGLMAAFWLPVWFFIPVKSRNDNNKAVGDVSTLTSDEVDASGDLESGEEAQEKAQRGSGIVALLMTKPVWAICVAQYTSSWGMYSLINWLPTFFNEQYGIRVEDVGFYTILPYFVQALVGMLSGPMADDLISRKWSIRTVRRVFQGAGMIGPALCLILAVTPGTSDSAETCSMYITVGLGLSALTLAGVSVSHLDVAPNHAGAVFGAGNTAATLAGFVSVWATGWILEQTHSWVFVFGVTAVHYVLGLLVWIVWVGESQLPQDKLTH